MTGLLAHAAMLQDKTFEEIRQWIADDEHPKTEREDPEFGAEEQQLYDEVLTMDPDKMIGYIRELQEGCIFDKDYETIAYQELTIERIAQIQEESASHAT